MDLELHRGPPTQSRLGDQSARPPLLARVLLAQDLIRHCCQFDLRNIQSPIIVFCSKADNITPPPQALGWILDLYEGVDDIRAHGQTIVYAVHEFDRSSRYLCVRIGRQEGTRSVREQHRSDRRATAGPLRGCYDAEKSERPSCRFDQRRLSRSL